MALALSDPRVWLVRDRPTYCRTPPFHAFEEMPEWPAGRQSREDNPAYRSVRRLLHEMDLDTSRFGTSAWNPLGDLIQPGQTVVLKPNLVTHYNHDVKLSRPTDTDSLVTHGSVVRAVADYAARAATPGGALLICDCPLQGTDWDAVVRMTGLEAVVEHLRTAFPTVDVSLIDFRLGTATVHGGRVAARHVEESRRKEYTEVDLGVRSLLESGDPPGYGFGVAQYGCRRMRAAHSATVNKYLMPNAVLQADVFINLPKLKTHMRTGMTCALKNLVGINGHKDYLPHYRCGSPRDGGDEYPDGNWWWDLTWAITHRVWELDGGMKKALLDVLAQVCRRASPLIGRFPAQRYKLGGGGWNGNDTIWRMCLDINRALFYYDRRSGEVGTQPYGDMAYVSIVDALVAGDGAGPLSPSPVPAALMLASFNPVAADTVATAIMGFEPNSVPMVARGYDLNDLGLAPFAMDDVRIIVEGVSRDVASYVEESHIPRFVPWVGFRGAIERGSRSEDDEGS
jgi:uncharacterized protein (DUF362 family)